MSFRSYLNAAAAADSTTDKFIAAARVDQSMPDVKRWAALKGYLDSKRAPASTVTAARTMWRRYRAARAAATRPVDSALASPS